MRLILMVDGTKHEFQRRRDEPSKPAILVGHGQGVFVAEQRLWSGPIRPDGNDQSAGFAEPFAKLEGDLGLS